jgi:hypothetical protein
MPRAQSREGGALVVLRFERGQTRPLPVCIGNPEARRARRRARQRPARAVVRRTHRQPRLQDRPPRRTAASRHRRQRAAIGGHRQPRQPPQGDRRPPTSPSPPGAPNGTTDPAGTAHFSTHTASSQIPSGPPTTDSSGSRVVGLPRVGVRATPARTERRDRSTPIRHDLAYRWARRAPRMIARLRRPTEATSSVVRSRLRMSVRKASRLSGLDR